MTIHPDHALLVGAVRHRELVAEAEAYRRARRAKRAAAEDCHQPAPATEVPGRAVAGCRPYPGRRHPGRRHPGRRYLGRRRLA